MSKIFVIVTKESDNSTHAIEVQNAHKHHAEFVLYQLKNLLDIPVHLSTVGEDDDIHLTCQKSISDDLFKLTDYTLTNLTKAGDLHLYPYRESLVEYMLPDHIVTYILPNGDKYLLCTQVYEVYNALQEVKPKTEKDYWSEINVDNMEELIEEYDRTAEKVYNKINEQYTKYLDSDKGIIELSPDLIKTIGFSNTVSSSSTGVQLNKLHKFFSDEDYIPFVHYLEKELNHLSNVEVYVFRGNTNMYYILPLENDKNLLPVIDEYLKAHKADVRKFVTKEIDLPVHRMDKANIGMNLINVVFNNPLVMDKFMLELAYTLVIHKE